jgi:hypothetical protein
MIDVNYKDIMIETVFPISGVQNNQYEKLNDFVSILGQTPSIIIPKSKTASLERLRMFIEKIKYDNLCMNFIENSITVDDITKLTCITDVSIVCDKTYTQTRSTVTSSVYGRLRPQTFTIRPYKDQYGRIQRKTEIVYGLRVLRQ